jgi:ankyrin repeat protein
MAAIFETTQEEQAARNLFNHIYLGEDSELGKFIAQHGSSAGAELDKLRDSDGRCAVHWAATGKQGEALGSLIRCGCSVQVQDKSGWTALHCAVSAGALACVELLLHAGADVNALNDKGQLPLHLVKGRRALVDSLLPSTIDCDQPDHVGFTPLHRAVLAASVDAVSSLLASGAEVNAKTHAGESVLHLAASLDADAMPAMVALLRQNSASSAALDASGNSAEAALKAARRTFDRLAGKS